MTKPDSHFGQATHSHPAIDINPADIQIKKMFATPVVLIPFAMADIVNPILSRQILEREQAHSGATHSNQGGWQSQDNFASWDSDAVQVLMAFITQAVNRTSVVSVNGELQEPGLAWRINSWANVNRRGAENVMHAHPGAWMSAVYWIDDGRGATGIVENGESNMHENETAAGGELELFDPRGIMPAMYTPDLRHRIEGCLSAGYSELVTPEAGTLCLFPSWLMHKVLPFRGDGVRISVACNYSI